MQDSNPLPGPVTSEGAATEDELRDQIAALLRERAFTQEQHRRWGEERQALLNECRQLSAEMDAIKHQCLASGILGLSPQDAEPAEFEIRPRLRTTDSTGGMRQMVRSLDECKAWIAELEQAKVWYQQQQGNWIEERQQMVQSLDECKAWIVELEQAKVWYQQQRDAWTEERQQLVHSLDDCKARIAELERTKAWYKR